MELLLELDTPPPENVEIGWIRSSPLARLVLEHVGVRNAGKECGTWLHC